MKKIAETYHGNEVFLFEEQEDYTCIVLNMLPNDTIQRVRFLFCSEEEARNFASSLQKAIDVSVLS